jgi:hypothetical protein
LRRLLVVLKLVCDDGLTKLVKKKMVVKPQHVFFFWRAGNCGSALRTRSTPGRKPDRHVT